MTRILIADDHDGTRAILRVLLSQHSGWEVCGEASTGDETLQVVATKELSSLISAVETVQHYSANRLVSRGATTKPTSADTGDVD